MSPRGWRTSTIRSPRYSGTRPRRSARHLADDRRAVTDSPSSNLLGRIGGRDSPAFPSAGAKWANVSRRKHANFHPFLLSLDLDYRAWPRESNFINPFQIEAIVTIFNHEDWFWKRLKTHPFSWKIYDFLQLWRTKRVIAIRQLNTLPLSGPLIFAPIPSNAITLPKLNPYHSSQIAFQFKSRGNSLLFCLSVVDNS